MFSDRLLEPEWVPVLSFLLFGSLLTVGQIIKFNSTSKNQMIADRYQGKSFQLISWRTFLCVVCTLIITGWSLSLLPFIPLVLPRLVVRVRDVAPGVLAIVLQLLNLVGMLASLVVFARHRLQTAVAALLLGIFWTIITFYQVIQFENANAFFASIAVLLVLAVILLSVASAKAISRRLVFLALGLILLIALNELSKLGLDVTAPKQG